MTATDERGSWPFFTAKFGETVRDAGVTLVPRVLLNSMGELKLKPIHLGCWQQHLLTRPADDGLLQFLLRSSNMSAETTRCPKCNGEMVQGFIFDYHAGGKRLVSNWVEGAPEKSWWR